MPGGRFIVSRTDFVTTICVFIVSEEHKPYDMNQRPLIIIMLLIAFSLKLSAQEENERRYSIQLNYGISRTLHYYTPVNFRVCFEGCYAEQQNARTVPNFDVSLYRKIGTNSSVKLGVGITSYKFFETGMESPVFGFVPYQMTYTNKYVMVSGGYRKLFKSGGIFRPFIEGELIYENLRNEEYAFTKFGLALKSKLGGVFTISKDIQIGIDGFYKSAITPYNEFKIDRNYFPFAYGAELSVIYVITPKISE